MRIAGNLSFCDLDNDITLALGKKQEILALKIWGKIYSLYLISFILVILSNSYHFLFLRKMCYIFLGRGFIVIYSVLMLFIFNNSD